jgi:threonine/homoserine/homoserine lactone efflux protein
MANPLLYFLVGMTACFIGTIPFGPINLTVVKTTVDYDSRRGTEVALAASIVEIFEALVAICFGLVISAYLESNLVIKLLIAIAFILLAGFVFTRKTDPSLAEKNSNQESFFRKGLLIAALNPQAIPFWIFALATISQYFVFEYVGIYLIGFLAGVFVGKLIALYGFVVASGYLKTHLQESSQLVSKILAGVLLFIGLSQGWNALYGLAA